MPKFEIWMPSDVVFMTAGLCLYQSPSRSHKYAIMQLMHFLRWPNTVFARAFADVIERAHKDCKNKNVINRAIILFIQNPQNPLFFSIIKRSVLMPLFFYYKDMLGKVTTQTTQNFLAFLCYRKNPVKCSACAVSRKIETDCFCRNLPISNDPVVRISRNLAKQ